MPRSISQIVGLVGLSLTTMFIGSQFVHVTLKPDVDLTKLLQEERERRKRIQNIIKKDD
jgi:hypothetical protein